MPLLGSFLSLFLHEGMNECIFMCVFFPKICVLSMAHFGDTVRRLVQL